MLFLQRLCRRHNRDAFSCGNAELDLYFKVQASIDVKYHDASCYVLVDERDPSQAVGFFTLTQTSLDRSDLPELSGGYKNHPLTLLGRFAVAASYQNQGIGGRLLLKALEIAKAMSEAVASRGLLVQAKDDKAQQFYMRKGFLLLQAETRTLLFPFKRNNKLPPEHKNIASIG